MTMKMMTLSPDQKAAMDLAVAKIEAREQCVTLGGYAGTGKTTVTGEIVKALRAKFPRIAFCCFTGKAYKVLEAKLRACGAMDPGDYCGTIHGLVYNARRHQEEKEEDGIKILKNRFLFDDKDENEKFDLIVVDEASMVNEIMYGKLLEFAVPILAIGDHGQLPPVRGEFNLMSNPMIRLTKIHRQAEHDPIVRLSIMAREDGIIPLGVYSQESDALCMKIKGEEFINENVHPHAWTLIAGTNKKRVERNKWARWKFGLKGDIPVAGDRVICLRNIHFKNVFNGMTGTVRKCMPSLKEKYAGGHWLFMDVLMDSETEYIAPDVFRYQFNQPKLLVATVVDPPSAREVNPDDFGALWDFGYCLTAHKAQGSEFDNVVVYEENAMRFLMNKTLGEEGWRRWLYTAVTRAKKQLIIVGE